MSKIKNIIFDLDGTLWDSREQIINAWNSVIPNNLINKNQLNQLMGKTNDQYLDSLFSNYSKEEAKIIMGKCEKAEVEYLNKHGAKLYEDVIILIKKLSKTYNLFIVSNCQDGYIESFLNYYNISKNFLDYECNGRTNKDKTENIKLLMIRNKLEKHETCYIGDTQSDYEASIKNNILFIFCKYGFGKISNCKKFIDKPIEIINLLRTLI